MAYLGNDLQVAFPVYRNIDDISGSFNSVLTTFALTVNGVAPVPAPLYSQQCLISVGGVVQRPDNSGSEGFRLSGGNIIFAAAPATGADFFGVILAGADYVNAGGNFPSGTASVPSITFNDDLDTGIYNSGANQVSITTAGTERLRIDSAGQIGSVSLGTTAAPAFSFTTDLNTGIYSPGADQVAISTNSSERIRIGANGQIGLSGANYGTSGQVLTSAGSGSAPTWTTIGNPNKIEQGNTSAEVIDTGSDGRFLVTTEGSERMRIDNAGRVGVNVTPTTNTRFDLSGTYAQNIVAVAALNIDCSAGNYFTKTINGNSTFTVSNIPASRAYAFTLELTHTSGTITWFSGVEWPNGTAPTLTTGKTHLFMFVTDDGGSRWRASSLINYTN